MPLQFPPMLQSDADPDRQAREQMCRQTRAEWGRRETTALTLLAVVGGVALIAVLRVVFAG